MQRYARVVIVGGSQLAAKCAEMAARTEPTLKITFFNIRGERPPKAVEELDNLEYIHANKAQLMEHLRETTEKTLVFSIMNTYLFPADVTKNPALTLINLHHALLPNHPGRNAEIWAIFEGDATTGVTWHMITPDVDAGEIILQRRVEITEHMTALKLFRALNQISEESFPAVFRAAMEGDLKTYPQPSDVRYPLRYAKDKPADGVLDLTWDIDKMYRFVRAMDYGILKVMGDPIVFLDGKRYTWKKYAYQNGIDGSSEKIKITPEEVQIRQGGKELRLIGMFHCG